MHEVWSGTVRVQIWGVTFSFDVTLGTLGLSEIKFVHEQNSLAQQVSPARTDHARARPAFHTR